VILDVRATPEEVMRAVGALNDFARCEAMPEKTAFGLAVALEECGSNIVNHALRGDANKHFQVLIERAGDAVIIELRDHGPAFDPTRSVPREKQPTNEDAIGGWGIQLVRKYVDEIQYERRTGQNVLRLTKSLRARLPNTTQDY